MPAPRPVAKHVCPPFGEGFLHKPNSSANLIWSYRKSVEGFRGGDASMTWLAYKTHHIVLILI